MAHATRPGRRYAAWLADGVQSAADRAVSNPASLGIGADMIGFGGGQPAAESYPLEALERAYSRAILEDVRSVLPYGPTGGLLALREIVAQRLGRHREPVAHACAVDHHVVGRAGRHIAADERDHECPAAASAVASGARLAWQIATARASAA